jgi:hypothetical protein
VALSRALEVALARVLEPRLSRKLREVCQAAATAIERLSSIDLIKHEPTHVNPGSADLSLWEEMAPVVRDTLVHVNRLLAAMRGQFPEIVDPAPPPSELYLAYVGAPSVEERLRIEAEAVLRGTHEGLTQSVKRLGERIRSPEVVSDRWRLLIELQGFRADCRGQIGDLVYLMASACADVRREEVVPGYHAEVTAMALLRRTAVDLLRSLQVKAGRLSGLNSAALRQRAEGLEQDLRAFIMMPASAAMYTEDKRQVAETRAALREAAAQTDLEEAQLLAHLHPVMELLHEVSLKCTREALVIHDRAVLSACGTRIAEAELHRAKGSPGARRALQQGIDAAAEGLYGVNEVLDDFLRKARVRPVSERTEDEFAQMIVDFRVCLQQVS